MERELIKRREEKMVVVDVDIRCKTLEREMRAGRFIKSSHRESGTERVTHSNARPSRPSAPKLLPPPRLQIIIEGWAGRISLLRPSSLLCCVIGGGDGIQASVLPMPWSSCQTHFIHTVLLRAQTGDWHKE